MMISLNIDPKFLCWEWQVIQCRIKEKLQSDKNARLCFILNRGETDIKL